MKYAKDGRCGLGCPHVLIHSRKGWSFSVRQISEGIGVSVVIDLRRPDPSQHLLTLQKAVLMLQNRGHLSDPIRATPP